MENEEIVITQETKEVLKDFSAYLYGKGYLNVLQFDFDEQFVETYCLKHQKGKNMENIIKETKEFRVALDDILQLMKGSERKSRERSLSVTKLQEAIMWLGMDLKEIGCENPYPNSYKPENTVIDPTADNLKL